MKAFKPSLRLAVAVACLLTGCSTIDVYDSRQNAQKGLLFYTKEPVAIQEVTYGLNAESVQIHVAVNSTPKAEFDFPSQAVNIIGESNTIDSIVDRLQKETNAEHRDLRQILAKAEVAGAELLKLSFAKHPKDTDPESFQLLSNTVRRSTRLAPAKYYINARNPLMGTSSATFKLSDDETLTESTASVTDSTASTLFAATPLSGLLSKQWDLAAAAIQPSSTTATTASEFKLASKNLDLDKLLGVQTTSKPVDQPLRILATVTVRRASDPRIYMLRQTTALKDGEEPDLKPFCAQTLFQDMSDGTIELVRTATASQLKTVPADDTKKPRAAQKPPAGGAPPAS